MKKNLIKRYEQGIHPCMLKFLIQYDKFNDTEAWYNGDHIITFLDERTLHYLPLWTYGYQPLIHEFKDLNRTERSLLKKYIEQNK